MGYMFQFVGADGGRGAIRTDVSGCFKGNARVVGPVFVFSILAGLAFIRIEISPSGDFLIAFRFGWIGLGRRFRRHGCVGSAGRGNLDGIVESLLTQ